MTDLHPVLHCADEINRALKDAADVAVEFMSPGQQREALLAISAAGSRLEHVRLRLIAAAGAAAEDDGSRDVASWLTHRTRSDRAANVRSQRLAQSLDRAWPRVRQGLAEAAVNPDQAAVIVRALDLLPVDVGADVLERAEAHLVDAAAHFGPRELRILGRRVLDVVAPELGEDAERRALEAEERHARRTTNLVHWSHGDGTTTLKVRVPDSIADRALTYLHAFTSPRHDATEPIAERVPHDVRLGHAFCSLLESLDPDRLPLHGGDGTTVMVTTDLATLRDGLGVAVLGAETRITAGEARRLACNARIVPLVLGGKSEPLDLGRARRLFSPAQRKAMAIRDTTCRAQGCDIPAAWCEAHHDANPWSRGGRTDLADGKLLCSWHHHRAHDDRYVHTELPGGGVRFHRRS
jgi:hypothetical protein